MKRHFPELNYHSSHITIFIRSIFIKFLINYDICVIKSAYCNSSILENLSYFIIYNTCESFVVKLFQIIIVEIET